MLAAPFDLERLEWKGEPVPVLEGVWSEPAFGTAHWALSRNGTLAYVPSVEFKSRLVWVDRSGSVQPMTETSGFFEDPRLSPDGRRLSLSLQEQGNLHVWIYEIERDSFSRLTFGPEQDQAAIWSPDGKRLTFRRGLPSNLFWVPADGSGPEERLTTSARSQRASSWSPDGRELVYDEWEHAAAFDLWILHLEAEPRVRPLVQTPFQDVSGIVSPDGRFLAYTSNETGWSEVYVRPFSGAGGKWRISSEGGLQPVWARSGREIFFRNGDKMMAVGVETEPEFRATKPAVLFEGSFYSPTVFFSQYDVTPDGKRFVMIQPVESFPTRIEVVLNWTEALKARVPVR